MKNRMYSYGYGIVDGKLSIIDEEAVIVKRIFTDYISGKVLKQIAEELTEEKINFYCGRTTWNKNMIFRIIENRKYIGGDFYQPIIEEGVFEKANGVKASKGSRQSEDSPENEYLKRNVYCKQCGKLLTRRSKWKTREKWLCSNGCKCDRYIDDIELYRGILQVVHKVSEYPNLLNQSIEFIPYHRTQEIMRYTNEINRMMNASKPNFNSIKKVILECATLKFLACKENRQEAYTEYVMEKTNDILSGDLIDISYLQEVITKVEIDKEGNIILCFINGAEVLSRNEEVIQNASDAAENSYEDRCQSVVI